MKKKLLILAKLLLSGLLLAYVLSDIDISIILDSLKNVSITWLLIAISLNGVGKVLSGFRWKFLLRAQSVEVPVIKLINFLFVGHFFNIFLPTTVGGDVVRVYDVSKHSKKMAQSVSTVIVERMMGILALAILAILGIVIGLFVGLKVSSFVGMVSLVLVFTLLGFIMIFNRFLIKVLCKFLEGFKLQKVKRKIWNLHEAFMFIRSKDNALRITFLYSLALQINVVLHYYFISVALDLDVILGYFFIVVPIIIILLMLPISINGIGLRENAYVFLFAYIGVAGQDAIALSWVAFGIVLLHGVMGGLVYAFRR